MAKKRKISVVEPVAKRGKKIVVGDVTAGQFKAIMYCCYGNEWKTKFHLYTGISKEKIKAWCNGTKEVWAHDIHPELTLITHNGSYAKLGLSPDLLNKAIEYQTKQKFS